MNDWFNTVKNIHMKSYNFIKWLKKINKEINKKSINKYIEN